MRAILMMLALVVGAFLGSAGQVQAKGLPLFFQTGDGMELAFDLPNTEEFTVDGGRYLDIAVLYQKINLFGIPLWQSDLKYVGMSGGNMESYYTLTDADLEDLTSRAGITIPAIEDYKMSFWKAWGGKLLVGLFALLVVVGLLRAGKGDDEDEGDDAKSE